MHHEFEDYRKKRPPEEPTPWSQWQPEDPLRYLLVIVFFILGIPFLFGYIPTPFGTLWQLIIIDYWMYMRAQTKKIDIDRFD